MSQPKLSGDSVRAYLRDIGRIPLLEHDEEIMLGRKVQRLMELEKIRAELQEDLGRKIDDRSLCDHTTNDWKERWKNVCALHEGTRYHWMV